MFFDRLRRAAAAGHAEVRFGGAHFSHAVCHEGDTWAVRRLELDRARAEAYRQTHGSFMPEHAEMLSTPGAKFQLSPKSLKIDLE